MNTKDTIFALSTPAGKSAISIVRISGKKATCVISKMSSNMPSAPRTANLNLIKSLSGETIDQTITTVYMAPKSYTGEDMVEIALHGGAAVTKKLFEELSRNKNLRIAEPGEFTRRAFENNKLDLTQVEAISDLVNSETEMQRKQAINHLSGVFFKNTKDIFEKLKKILANIEAFIDFSDEDLPSNLLLEVKEQNKNIIKKIDKILSDSSVGISIRSGFSIAITGMPNTGKSSFINKVSGKNVSIVTSIPGTTRDLIESFIDIDGYPFKFLDTAGIRKSENKIEKIGINLAIKAAEESDINLIFINNPQEKNSFKSAKKTIYIKSKQDLSLSPLRGEGFYNISSKTGYGIKHILSLIKERIQSKSPIQDTYISRERHKNCLKKTLNFLKSANNDKNIDLISEDFRLALREISKLFGNVDIEDILNIIFSDFCIGK